MQREQIDFDPATLEAMMQRYRAELLKYQRATPPGKPTLSENVINTEPPQDDFSQPAITAGFETKDALPQIISPPEDDLSSEIIFEQPAYFTYENAEPPKSEIIEVLPVEQSIEPEIEPTEPAILCACHTEFEKCIGAYGSFRSYEQMGKYTKAHFLRAAGEITPVLVRFACDLPKGEAETRRCRRSFSVKFFCPDGEYDMFSSQLPITMGSSEQTLAECCDAMRADPVSGIRSKEPFWRFVLKHNEALSCVLWLYSDLGTPASYRAMDGFSPPCYWVNSAGEKSLVRTCWLSIRRPQTLNRIEAEELAGSDPDFLSRDLAAHIKQGEKPQYELAAQIIPYKRLASGLGFDPFDPTIQWPQGEFALQKLGLLTLEKMPGHFEKEVLRAEFKSENIINGIEYAPLLSSAELKNAAAHIRAMGEFSQKILIDNICEDLKTLPADLMEQVLILFTNADLEFGRALTMALGGM